MSALRLGLMTIATVVLLSPALPAQAVGFFPVPSALPVGPTLGVTPVVSADRRYVRLSLNAQFIDNASFTTLSVPAAVGGGPGGPGALGRLGLGMGGGGLGAGAGGGGVGGAGAGAVGGQFLAGMNGVIDPSTMGYGYGYGYGGMPPGAGMGVDPSLGFMGNALPGWGMMPRPPSPPRAPATRARTTSKTPKAKATSKPQARATRPSTSASAPQPR
jgi:hypothetical protein